MAVRRIGARGGPGRPDVHTLQTAKLNDVDPQAWLADVLARIADTPQTKLAELLPWNWATERLKEISGLDEISFHMSGTEAPPISVGIPRRFTRTSRKLSARRNCVKTQLIFGNRGFAFRSLRGSNR